MTSLLNWQTDGTVAQIALVLFGLVFLFVVLVGVRGNKEISRLLPPALVWHLVIWAFVAFWMLPSYAALDEADSYGYHHDGIVVAQSIRAGDWGAIPVHLGTDMMPLITGILYTPFGGDIFGMTFFSAVMGLCSTLYLCRAFSLWATPPQLRSYSFLMLFLPSFATWTSTYGKDCWVSFGLGLAAYGYSLMLGPGGLTGLWYLVGGGAIITAIRPHISVALVAAMTLAYVGGLTKAHRGSIFGKIAMVAMLIGMLALLSSVASGFLGLEDVSADSMEDLAQTKGQNNAIGGSAVEIQAAPGLAGALMAFPRGIVRVLFQPFPWEVHNVNTGLAAAENVFILVFAFSHVWRVRGLLGGIAREPYFLFSSTLACGLLLVLSFIPNLGLLSRERVQLLPFLFAPLVAANSLRKRRERPRRLNPFPDFPLMPDAGLASHPIGSSVIMTQTVAHSNPAA